MDSFPIISQCKSAVQAICGDTKGATKTQERFLKTCPIISQGTSAVQAMMGDMEGAKETQLEFVELLSNTADVVPVVGHIKGGIHYACGDKEGGDKAMKSSSRTFGVLVGGVAGFSAGGPPGAFAGGVAGGLALDALTTGIDSAVHNKFRPTGTIAAVDVLVEGKSESVSGDVFDLVVGTAMDGMLGIATGEQVGRMSKVGLEGEAEVAKKVPNDKQSHVKGAMDDVKSLKGDDIRKMKSEAGDLTKVKQEIKENTNLSKNQKRKQMKALNKDREMHTQHNIHGLTEDRQGQIAADLKPTNSSGGRCAERLIFEDPKRNYHLKLVEYLDDHKYGRVAPKPKPGAFTRAANFVADHTAVHVTAAAIYPVIRGSKRVAKLTSWSLEPQLVGLLVQTEQENLGREWL